jgi:hypothetical protein
MARMISSLTGSMTGSSGVKPHPSYPSMILIHTKIMDIKIEPLPFFKSEG